MFEMAVSEVRSGLRWDLIAGCGALAALLGIGYLLVR